MHFWILDKLVLFKCSKSSSVQKLILIAIGILNY